MTIVVQSGVLRSSGPDITTGLVSYWPFTTDGTDTQSGHNLTLAGGAAVTASQLVLATADTDYASVADHADFNFGTAMTCFGWITTVVLGTDRSAISQYDFGNSQRSWTISCNAGNTMRVVLVDTNNQATRKIYDGADSVFEDGLHSVAFTWGSSTLKLYVDGVLDASPTLTQDDSFTTLHNSTADLTIGALRNNGSTTGSGLEGNYSKFRLYNIAKTAADIAAMHALGA